MGKLSLALNYIRDIFHNVFSHADVVLISEPVRWSIYEDCVNIRDRLSGTVRVRIAYTPIGLRNKVVHFASVGTLVRERGIRRVHPSNRVILTWFHVVPGDRRLAYVSELNNKITRLHTSCTLTAEQLIAHGFDREKITIIPIGVNTAVFRSAKEGEKERVRAALGIPDTAVVVGSFQKDGAGWGQGMEPKAVKGPEVFCDAVERIAAQYPVHVLLTGPSRGYVKGRLDAAGIPHTHRETGDADGIAPYYRALDLYLISSRAEGGPKALLEAAASGIPLVTTAVGMVPDIMEDGKDCLVVPVDDAAQLAEKAAALLQDEELRGQIARAAIETAKRYDSNNTVRQYGEKIYQNLLKR